MPSTVQIIDKLEPNLGILVQEFIETKFDVRVIVIAGKAHGAIMRPVLKKDFTTCHKLTFIILPVSA